MRAGCWLACQGKVLFLQQVVSLALFCWAPQEAQQRTARPHSQDTGKQPPRPSVLSPTTASRVTFYRNTTTLVRVILVYNDCHNFFHLENCFYLCVYVCVGICTDVCSKKPEEGAGCPGAGVTVVVSCHVSAGKRTWVLWSCWATLLIS